MAPKNEPNHNREQKNGKQVDLMSSLKADM